LKSKFIHNVLFVHTHEETQTIYECEAKLLKSKFIHNVLFVHTHEETQTIYECEAKLLPRKIINMNNSFPPNQFVEIEEVIPPRLQP
jgi:hypothetical protein